MFEQQWEAGGLSGQDSPARGLEHFLLGNFALTDVVIEPGGFGGLAFLEKLLGTSNAPLRHGRTNRVGRLGQGLLEGLGGALPADAAQGHSRGRRHLGIGIAQFGHKLRDGGRITPHTKRVDGPDQQPALHLGQGLRQGILGHWTGNGLEGDARPGGKVRVGKQRSQRRHGLAGAAGRQAFAGQRLFARRRLGFKHADELLFPFCKGLGRRGPEARQEAGARQEATARSPQITSRLAPAAPERGQPG